MNHDSNGVLTFLSSISGRETLLACISGWELFAWGIRNSQRILKEDDSNSTKNEKTLNEISVESLKLGKTYLNLVFLMLKGPKLFR